ncbi:hypothetical protein LR48_Vigan1041s000100 [Vigna angularis]|uniref:Putative plant transposon protein domain-containing protein n=1 Tax=Phaseolus angularis TaxID=3914 RepID=A0A0L9TIF8_PHAAN|nr:hypothetical protein LR48_Vigan1041s000100 [Vigna angularis]
MTSSSGKRLKTMATKRKEKEPEQSYSSRFLSRKHEKHFRVVQDRRLLMERKVGMIPNFAPQFGEQVLGNDWGKLATYPAPANIVVVKEFYTNAKKIGDYPAANYLGYVRGHAIRYDPDFINNFLDTVWAGEQCQFSLCMEEGADYEDVERVLCIPGGHFQRNRSGSVVNIRRTDLTPLAKYWMAFSHANIQPCSHVSDITLSRALFIYCAIRNLNVNIGQVIADEISVCANTSNNKEPLGHPSLITHLCKLAGVDTSVPPFERPRKAIDEAYYRQYCGGEDVAQPVPPCRARRERGPTQSQTSAETHEAEPFQMRDMYMSLIGEFGERSEEEEKGNQKRHQKVQKEKPQLPLSGILLLSGTQKVTGGEFGERSEEGEKGNQKRHQKVQKEKPQLLLSGSLPLSDTQEFTGDPLRGKMVAEGKNRARALTAERFLDFDVEAREENTREDELMKLIWCSSLQWKWLAVPTCTVEMVGYRREWHARKMIVSVEEGREKRDGLWLLLVLALVCDWFCSGVDGREFGERSEEGEKGNQKRHQKVQKEKPQLLLSGSLPLSDTQEFTGDPLRGKMVAEGKNRARALTAERYFTAERHTYGLGPNFSVINE